MFGFLERFCHKATSSCPVSKGGEGDSSTVLIKNNKQEMASLHIKMSYADRDVTFTVGDSSRSEDELVDLYRQKICDDCPQFVIDCENVNIIVQKNAVLYYTLRKGSAECIQI